MSEEEFVLALVGIISGTVLFGIFATGFFGLIKTWINRKKSESELDPRFFKALSEFKRNTEQRLENLEEIVIEEDIAGTSNRSRSKGKEAPSIQIEEEDLRKSSPKEKDSSNLRNMLDE